MTNLISNLYSKATAAESRFQLWWLSRAAKSQPAAKFHQLKITHQNTDLLQFVRKIFLQQVLKRKITTNFTILYKFKCIWA